MTYQEIFEQLGFKYMGPCSCRYAKGYIYRSPHSADLELWIYPVKKIVKKRLYGITKDVVGYQELSELETLIKTLGEI